MKIQNRLENVLNKWQFVVGIHPASYRLYASEVNIGIVKAKHFREYGVIDWKKDEYIGFHWCVLFTYGEGAGIKFYLETNRRMKLLFWFPTFHFYSGL